MARILVSEKNGKKIYHTRDEMTGDIFVETEQDLTDKLEQMKQIKNNDEELDLNGFNMYAFIPDVYVEKWMRQYNINPYHPAFDKLVDELLNTREYEHLKTIKGRA